MAAGSNPAGGTGAERNSAGAGEEKQKDKKKEKKKEEKKGESHQTKQTGAVCFRRKKEKKS